MQQRQAFVQQQQLKMNPQLLQSIKLMELPVMDLRERIQQELEVNPALEVVEDNTTVSLDETEEEEKYEYFESTSDSGRRGSELAEEHRKFIEGVLTRPETLQEHLLRQLQLEPVDDDLRSIAEMLIQNLDDNGFHKEKPETLFSEHQPRLFEAMTLVRGLDPVGTCAGDYRESLLIQIAHDQRSYDQRSRDHKSKKQKMPEEISNGIKIAIENLDLVERDKYAALAKKTNLDEEDARFVCDYIKNFSPFPGRTFASASSEVRYVIPDIKVVRDGDEFSINLNDEVFPVLGTNLFFEKMSASNDKAVKEFAREKIREARLFINHLSQRNKTLIRVANAILEFQTAVFYQRSEIPRSSHPQ